MILSTTSELQGREVEDYVGLVFAETVLGTSFVADVSAGWTDLFGARSGAYEQKMLQARHSVVSRIVARAGELGADAILGVRLDYETIGQSMMMMSASGTAVRLKTTGQLTRSPEQIRTGELLAYWERMCAGWYEIDDYLGEVTKPLSDEMIRSAQVQNGVSVVDLGCGTGESTLAACQASTGRVMAVDISQSMLRSTRERASGRKNIEYLVEDARNVPGIEDSIDVALFRFSLPLIDDPVKALACAYRMLKPGGRVSIAVWASPDRNRFLSAPFEALRALGVSGFGPMAGMFELSDEATLVSMLESAGFKEPGFKQVQMSLHAATFYRYWNFIRQYFGDVGTLPVAIQDTVRREIGKILNVAPLAAIDFSAQGLVCTAVK